MNDRQIDMSRDVLRQIRQYIEFETIFITGTGMTNLLSLCETLFLTPSKDVTRRIGTYFHVDFFFQRLELTDLLVLLGLVKYATEELIQFQHDAEVYQHRCHTGDDDDFIMMLSNETKLRTKVAFILEKVCAKLQNKTSRKILAEATKSTMDTFFTELEFADRYL